MESKTHTSLNRGKQSISICSELNLDITKLEDKKLLSNPTYLRLYSIVKNDMSRSELSFRKNLIRELYFLLQIAPIINPEAKEVFLEEVQKMYNIHDHKKIDLGSKKLNNLMSIVHSKKESAHESAERPKSGTPWNTNVPSFLRPYTATRPKQTNRGRPQSSKFNYQSTRVSTTEDIYIRQFSTNIQEELEISKDFLEKHRTVHPQYQPVYQQLYNILKTVQTRVAEPQPQKSPHKKIKYPKSAITRHKQDSWVKPQQIRNTQHFNTEEAPETDLVQQKQVPENEDNNESSDDEEYLYVNEQKKNSFKAYSMKMKAEEKYEEDAKNREGFLNKYSHLVKTKLAHAVRQDEEIAKKYVHYAKFKSTLRKEMSRRSQSKRLMSAKMANRSNITYNKAPSQIDKENEEKGFQIIDLDKDPLVLPAEKIRQYPTYNQRQLLKGLYKQPVNQFKKSNIVGYVHSSQQKLQRPKRPMTSYVRFHSPERFDPLSSDNVKKHNEDAMEEIQQIKQKLGGKCYASTETLMKALAVPDIPPLEEQISWQNKSPFFNMVSQGLKKLKKKSRKAVKLQKKNTVVRK